VNEHWDHFRLLLEGSGFRRERAGGDYYVRGDEGVSIHQDTGLVVLRVTRMEPGFALLSRHLGLGDALVNYASVLRSMRDTIRKVK
jgi:hypothetical protein